MRRSIDDHPLVMVERPVPTPARGQMRVRVLTCGVCRTDLHLAEGDLAPRRPQVTPGHEVVGIVDALGDDVATFALGDRVGVPWLAHTDGTCRFCTSIRENLCVAPQFTGWDVDGGYAEYLVADADYVYAVPSSFDDVVAAPLLCAGIIGYRALRQAQCPPEGRLGIYGFGASAHLTAQIAIAEGLRVHVLTRAARARELASRSTRRSCSPRSARSCPPRSKRWTAAARSQSRASTSRTRRRSTTSATSSRNGGFAA